MTYDAPLGQRMNRYGIGVSTSLALWWNETSRRFVPISEAQKRGEHFSSHAPCRTVRAFRRIVRQNPHIRGHAIFESAYVGHNIRG